LVAEVRGVVYPVVAVETFNQLLDRRELVFVIGGADVSKVSEILAKQDDCGDRGRRPF